VKLKLIQIHDQSEMYLSFLNAILKSIIEKIVQVFICTQGHVTSSQVRDLVVRTFQSEFTTELQVHQADNNPQSANQVILPTQIVDLYL